MAGFSSPSPAAASLKPRASALENALFGPGGYGMDSQPLAPRVAALELAVGGEGRRTGCLGLAPRIAALETELRQLADGVSGTERAMLDESSCNLFGEGSRLGGLASRAASLEHLLGVGEPLADGLFQQVSRMRRAAADAVAQTAVLEEVLRGRNSGAGPVGPRVASLQHCLDGTVGASSPLLSHIGALKLELKSLGFRVGALERDMRGRASTAVPALAPRVAALELDVNGCSSTGPLLARVTALEADVSGRQGEHLIAGSDGLITRGPLIPRTTALEAEALRGGGASAMQLVHRGGLGGALKSWGGSLTPPSPAPPFPRLTVLCLSHT